MVGPASFFFCLGATQGQALEDEFGPQELAVRLRESGRQAMTHHSFRGSFSAVSKRIHLPEGHATSGSTIPNDP